MDDDDDGFSTTPAPPVPRQNRLLTLARDNLALLIPIVGALIFAFRCILVSSGDPHVAFILATQTSVGDAIRALLFTVVPALLFLLSILAGLRVGMRIRYINRHNYLSILGMALVSVVSSLGYGLLSGNFQKKPLGAALFFLSLPFAAFLFIIMFEATRREEMREGSSVKTRVLWQDVGTMLGIVATWLLIGLLALGSTLIDKTFWLPRERLDFQNEDPFTGYVLKASEDYLIILNDRPRVIVQKSKDTLEDRDFCYPEDHKARSSNVKSDAPECP